MSTIVICGAGIAGVTLAYTLAQRGVRDIVLVDSQPPLSLTSDKSTECYRDFWPGPGSAMVQLMGHSIDLLEAHANASNNIFRMNQRGYLYVTRTAQGAANLLRAAQETAALGAGPLRVFSAESVTPLDRGSSDRGSSDRGSSDRGSLDRGSSDRGSLDRGSSDRGSSDRGLQSAPPALRGADLISDPALIRELYPFLAPDVVAVLHARRCGWLSAQQLGMYLLEQARTLGVRFVRAEVEQVEVQNNQVTAVQVSNDTGSQRIPTNCFVNCAGPMLAKVGRMFGIALPVFSERHIKLAFEDRLHVIPREAPMVINADPVTIEWTDEERELLAEDAETMSLLSELPPGAHLRPEGEGSSQWVLALWAYDAQPVEEIFPPPIPEQFAEIAMHGIAAIVPGLKPYLTRSPRRSLDAGYYTKTHENRPLIGPLPIEGAYVLGALSGYGIMAACGAADLLAAHMLQEPLPEYAAAFLLSRYADPEYQALLANWGDSGQL